MLTYANPQHASYVWNNLWLACLALTTSDYGAFAPATLYARAVCVVLAFVGMRLLTYADVC
jgi:hypothetical protein